jgi:hypothetical protein
MQIELGQKTRKRNIPVGDIDADGRVIIDAS